VPLLECRGLTRRFGALVAVDGFDLTVEPGEIRAVIGPNGAGKSTVFNLITSVLKPRKTSPDCPSIRWRKRESRAPSSSATYFPP
jgi:ABC-type branched-subunit amino acid transport system ATPase component